MINAIRIISHIAFWGITYVFVSRVFGIETIEINETEDSVQEIITYDHLFINATLICLFVGAFLFYTHDKFLLQRYFQNKKTISYLMQLVGLLLGSFILLIGVNNIFIYNSINASEYSIHPSINIHGSLLVFYFASSLAYGFTKEWFKNEKLKNELIQDKLSTELNYLKSQINPHFLYNTLNNLYSIAQKYQIDELSTGISELSNLMRYMLHDSNTDFVLLSREVKYIESFIGIQQLRLSEDDDFVIDFVLDGQIGSTKIAPMILISFVENAFKHGISLKGKSIITLKLEVDSKAIHFSIVNSIHREHMNNNRKSGIGLENVKRRLQLIYPDQHTLTINEKNDKFEVYLKIMHHAATN